MKTKQYEANNCGKQGGRYGTRRKVLHALVTLLCAAGPAYALPTGPQVINGTAGITINGNVMTVTNSPNAIINWGSFSIASGETTKFVQQSAASAVLNRVTGGDPSAIYGSLLSNGKVFLINQNGILFGPGAVVNVNGLVASTLNITNDDFLAGKMKFTAGTVFGTVDNRGTITTPSGGQVYLIAPDVKNSGVITAPNGDILLAAGREILLVDSATPEIAVVVSAPEHQAINLGTLTADAGRVGLYGGIVRQKGIVSANSAVRDASGRIFLKATKEVTVDAGSVTTANGPQGGSITLQASEGTTLVSGTVEAKGSAGTGGTVQVLGTRVGLTGNAVVDASGSRGGGTVLVGGDYQGKNATVQNAQFTYLGKDAVIKADATDNGNGGKVILWSDDVTRAYGSVFARGGANGGDGGFVETSGKGYLDFQAKVNTLAPHGKMGSLLLDPTNITIAASGPDIAGDSTGIDIVSSTDLDDAVLSYPGANSVITAIALANLLGTNTTLAATNDITVNAAISTSPGYTQGLTLNAGHDININAAISRTGGGDITLSAGNAINLGALLETQTGMYGGTVTLSTGSGSVSANAGASITAGYLKVISGGAANLAQGNTVDYVAANVAGDFNYTSNSTFTVFSIGGTNGITSTGGNVSLEATGSNYLLVNNQISAVSGQAKLKADKVEFNAGSSVIAKDVDITATGTLGVYLTGGSIGDSTYTRQVSFETDAISGTGTTVTTSASDIKNEIHFSPYTANATVGVAGGSGTLSVGTGVLGLLDAPTVVFGNESGSTKPSGNITVNPFSWVGGNRQRVALLSAGTVSGNGIDSQQLGVIAGGAVNLTGNNLSAIAIESASGGVTFTNSTAGFTVTSATGGITNPRTITGVSSGGANITLGTVSSGDITFAAPVNAGNTGAVTLNAAGKLLNGSGGVNIYGASLSAQAALGIGTNTLSLMTKTPLWSSVSSSGGSIYLDNTGAVQTGSLQVSALSGEVKLSAHSPLTIGTGGVQAGSDITLEASPMGGLDDLTINGPVTSSSGNIYLRAGNQIFENALITALNGSITRTPFLNGMLVPPNLQPQTPSAPLYSDGEVPAGLVLVSLEEQGDGEEDKDKKYGTSQEDRTRSGDTQNAKPKKNYCN